MKRIKLPEDLRLKIAILERRTTQRRVAMETRIAEGRVSEIVGHRGAMPSQVEQQRIAKFLGREREDLFTADEIAFADAAAISDAARRTA